MKRARSRKSKKQERYIEKEKISENYSEIFPEDDEPNDFAVPDEVFEANTEKSGFENISDDEASLANESVESGETVKFDLKDSDKMKKIGKIKKKRKKRRIVTIVLSVVFILAVLVAVIMGLDFTSTDKTAEEVYDFSAVDNETGKLNVLVLGVDKEGLRSDSIMLISYDFDTHATKLLSVPRDTKMYVTDRKVTRKITEVHGMHNAEGKLYGAGAVAEAVTSITGMPINYYVEFSFDALDNLMDILGPVEFDVPDIEGGGRGMNYDDPTQDLHIHLKPGLQELSGNQIQQFLRYRKSNNGTSDGSDLSRVGRQQELLQAIIEQKVNLELITKVPGLFKELKSQLKTNLSSKDIIKYAGALKDVSGDNMESFVLPGDTAMINKKSYFVCDLAQTAEMINMNFGYDVTVDDLSTDISLTGKKASGKTETSDSKKSDKTQTDSQKSEDKISITVSEEKEKPSISENTETKKEAETEEIKINTKKDTKKNETTEKKTDNVKKSESTKKTETSETPKTDNSDSSESNKKEDTQPTESKTDNSESDEKKESSDSSENKTDSQPEESNTSNDGSDSE